MWMVVGHFSVRHCRHVSCMFQSSHDKSSSACKRRIKHMMKNSETVQNVNLYLTEAKTDKVRENYLRRRVL